MSAKWIGGQCYTTGAFAGATVKRVCVTQYARPKSYNKNLTRTRSLALDKFTNQFHRRSVFAGASLDDAIADLRVL